MFYWEKQYGSISPSCHYKLILRPISDLKKDIIHNGEKYNFWEYMFIPTYERKLLETWIQDNKSYLGDSISYLIINELIEHHFDIFNLIEEGVAVSYNDEILKPIMLVQ